MKVSATKKAVVLHKSREEQSIWVSQEKQCFYFRHMPGYRKLGLPDRREMWKLIQHLIDTGYKVG